MARIFLYLRPSIGNKPKIDACPLCSLTPSYMVPMLGLQHCVRVPDKHTFDTCALCVWTFSTNEHGSVTRLHNNVLVNNLSKNQLFCVHSYYNNSKQYWWIDVFLIVLNDLEWNNKFITCNIFCGPRYSFQMVPHIIIFTIRCMNET